MNRISKYDIDTIPKETIGSHVLAARQKLGWSQRQMADFLKCHPSHSYNMERLAFTASKRIRVRLTRLFHKAQYAVDLSGYPFRLGRHLVAALNQRAAVKAAVAAGPTFLPTNGHHQLKPIDQVSQASEPRPRTRVAPQVACPTCKRPMLRRDLEALDRDTLMALLLNGRS